MNKSYGILEWTNENSLSAYPLSRRMDPPDFIVDATFLQFDGFTPVLKSVTVTSSKLTLVLTTDAGDVSVSVNRPTSSYFPGYSVSVDTSDRHLGYLVFGQGLVTMFALHLDATLKLNIPFSPSVVRGVSSRAGVYSLEGLYGDVVISTGENPEDRTVMLTNVTDDYPESGNIEVEWSAGSLGRYREEQPLLTINGVSPLDNALFLQESEVIKVSPNGNKVGISLAVPIGHTSISPATTYA